MPFRSITRDTQDASNLTSLVAVVNTEIVLNTTNFTTILLHRLESLFIKAIHSFDSYDLAMTVIVLRSTRLTPSL